jgi:hypothetical protein
MEDKRGTGTKPVDLVVAHSERATEQLLVVTDELVATTLERDALLEHLAVARAKAEHWKCEHDTAAREAHRSTSGALERAAASHLTSEQAVADERAAAAATAAALPRRRRFEDITLYVAALFAALCGAIAGYALLAPRVDPRSAKEAVDALLKQTPRNEVARAIAQLVAERELAAAQALAAMRARCDGALAPLTGAVGWIAVSLVATAAALLAAAYTSTTCARATERVEEDADAMVATLLSPISDTVHSADLADLKVLHASVRASLASASKSAVEALTPRRAAAEAPAAAPAKEKPPSTPKQSVPHPRILGQVSGNRSGAAWDEQ